MLLRMLEYECDREDAHFVAVDTARRDQRVCGAGYLGTTKYCELSKQERDAPNQGLWRLRFLREPVRFLYTKDTFRHPSIDVFSNPRPNGFC